MKIRIPKQLDAPEVKPVDDGRVRQVRHYKLITPLFGGGVKPNRADPITTVRGTEVRGQLRFWWRATRGGQLGDNLERMHRREEEIWGSAAGENKPGQSNIIIHVKCLAEGEKDRPFEVVLDKKGKPKTQPRKSSLAHPYAAFPLQPKKEDAYIGMETEAVKVGVEFTLDINYPKDLEQDVQATLWAWETFGGLGARTRRGFGSLQLLSIDSEPIISIPTNQIENWLCDKLQQHISSGTWHKDVPHLSHNMHLKVIIPKSQSSSSIQIWSELIQCLKDFRQKRKMGLSMWPEANEIRQRHEKELKWPPQYKSPKLVKKFPRAVFGLPIIFHLPHDTNLPYKSFTLQGKNHPISKKTFERVASVLILKPIPCENDKAVGIAVVLDAPTIPPYGLEINELDQDNQPVQWQLDGDDANSTPIREILHGETDVIEAFMKSLDTIFK